MQRMEVMIRYTDDEGQVLSESNMSFGMLDIDFIPREERLDQLESDTLNKGHEIMRHMFLSQCQLVDQQLAEKCQHSDADCHVQFDGKIASRLFLDLACFLLDNEVVSWYYYTISTNLVDKEGYDAHIAEMSVCSTRHLRAC